MAALTEHGAAPNTAPDGLRQESLLQMFGVQEFHEERPTEREAEMARPALTGDPLTLALPVRFCFAPLPLALPVSSFRRSTPIALARRPVGFHLADWPLGKQKKPTTATASSISRLGNNLGDGNAKLKGEYRRLLKPLCLRRFFKWRRCALALAMLRQLSARHGRAPTHCCS